jgi:two-component system response regulator PilR (NtrC family)
MIPRNILIVDDEISMCDFLTVILTNEGYKVKAVQDGVEALKILQEESFPCMITDLKMPNMDGLELVSRAREIVPELGVVVITAYASLQSAVEALRLGAMDYVTKPFKVDEIKIVIAKIFDQIELKRENAQLRKQLSEKNDLDSIIGKSEEMRKLLDLIRRVAPTDSTILITGESGTGKELVAQAIHLQSKRSNGPFVSINCGALPETLLESELFGHVKGSFTGAIKNKDGLFKVADGGTLFLDEIGDMSQTIQVKLLRALQEKEVMPIGATQPIPVDCRVLAATNANLEERIASGEFRNDLYYRLSVIPIRLASLRERRDDIPLLTNHFLKKICQQNALEPKTLSQDAMEKLIHYDWPGNVRELENAIERSVILEESPCITVDTLPGKIVSGSGQHATEFSRSTKTKTLEELEKDYLIRVLKETNWQKKRAADILGIDASTIYRKMQRYGITHKS